MWEISKYAPANRFRCPDFPEKFLQILLGFVTIR